MLRATTIDRDYKQQIIDTINSSTRLRHAECQICQEPCTEGVSFEGCQGEEPHVAHEMCVAREMAALKIISLQCQVCNAFTLPTIHSEGLNAPTQQGDDD